MKKRVCFLLTFFILASCAPRPSVYVPKGVLVPKGAKIAVLPFTNLTDSQGAGEKIAAFLMVEILKTGKVEVVDPGRVENILTKERIRLLDRLSPSSLKKLTDKLGVDYVVEGTVLEYRVEKENRYKVPFLALSVRLVDTRNGKIIWAASYAASGKDFEKIFGIGRVTSIERLGKNAASVIAKSFQKIIGGV